MRSETRERIKREKAERNARPKSQAFHHRHAILLAQHMQDGKDYPIEELEGVLEEDRDSTAGWQSCGPITSYMVNSGYATRVSSGVYRLTRKGENLRREAA